MTDITTIDNREGLQKAYDGSYYFIAGTGGDLQEWVDGYEKALEEEGIGKPTEWLQTSGALINEFANLSSIDDNPSAFPGDLPCLMFPLDGLNMGRLPLFKLSWMDRWFDDVIDNMRSN